MAARKKTNYDENRAKNGLRLLHHEVLNDLKGQLPEFQIPQLFIVWFLEANFGLDVDQGKACVTDGPHDKGIDAIYIDEQNKCVYLIQSKYSARPTGSQKKEDLIHVASIARTLCNGYDEDFEGLLKNARKDVDTLLRTAYDRLWARDYDLQVLFVTCSNVSDGLRRDIRREFRRIRGAQIKLFALDEVLHLAEQYFDGEVPAIDQLTIKPVNGKSVIQHGEKGDSLRSFVLECRCTDFVKQITGSRFPLHLFFHRNIRGFLGDAQPVNADIKNTLQNEPHLFFYLNNGITILATDVSATKGALSLAQPQIINGQQTTHVLVASLENTT